MTIWRRFRARLLSPTSVVADESCACLEADLSPVLERDAHADIDLDTIERLHFDPVLGWVTPLTPNVSIDPDTVNATWGNLRSLNGGQPLKTDPDVSAGGREALAAARALRRSLDLYEWEA